MLSPPSLSPTHPRLTLQITRTAPMVQVDTTDSGHIYLSRESLTRSGWPIAVRSISACLWKGKKRGQPAPEMFRTVVKDGKLVTIEHSGKTRGYAAVSFRRNLNYTNSVVCYCMNGTLRLSPLHIVHK